MTPTITDDQIFTSIRTFLLAVVPTPFDAVQAQVNRVAEPQTDDFAVMTEVRRTRLRTNVDGDADASFEASIADNVMTVTSVGIGTLVAGATLFGSGVVANTKIIEQLDGTPGGIGSYSVDQQQTFTQRVISAGAKTIEQGTQVLIQLDIHGDRSADNSQVISTVMRDAYGVQLFEAQGLGVVPLYADDPHQAPFINDQSQYENRWVVEAMLQVNPVVTIPQEFADVVDVALVEVDATYPP